MLDQLDLIDVHGVAKLFCCHENTVWRMVGDGRLPSPVQLGKSKKWFRSSIDKAVQEMIRKSEMNLASNRPQRKRYA